MSNLSTIANISYQDVDKCPEFAHGKFFDLEIVIDKSNGWINATHLCKQFPTTGEGPKEYNYWSKTDSAKALIKSMEEFEGMTCTKPISFRLNRIVRGTYVHPRLIPYILQWCSFRYIIQIADIIITHNEYLQLQAKEEAIATHNNTLKELIEERELATQEAKRNAHLINEQYYQIAVLKQNLVSTKCALKTLIKESAVIPPEPHKRNIVMVVNKYANVTDPTVYIPHELYNNRITVRRIQIGNKTTTLTNILSKNKWAKEVFTLETTYAVPVWIVAKTLLMREGKLYFKESKMMLTPSTTGTDIIAKIQHVYDNRVHYKIDSLSRKPTNLTVATDAIASDDEDQVELNSDTEWSTDELTDDGDEYESFLPGEEYDSDTDEAINGPSITNVAHDDISTNSNSFQ